VTNQLYWNANGSLYRYVYTDGGTPSAPSQTCTYGADDLSRIASVSCVNGTTSELAQNFTYDPFGNIQKTVPTGGTGFAYSAAYHTATNQVSSGITPAPVYDLNGNQKNLTATGESISWNAQNQPISMNGVTATYDALGRMVETGSGGSYQQFVFTPDGNPYAIYNAGTSTLVKGTVPLPGGDAAIYNVGGLSYLRHTDWLGSSRLATTWAHTVYSKTAYAPFGETYNEATGSGVSVADRSFTGDDQDVVSGSGGTGAYDFLFRKQDPSAGRWLSPDPYGWGAVDQTNPQTLNRYAYVDNQPMNSFDPQGLYPAQVGNCFYNVLTQWSFTSDGGGGGYSTDGGYVLPPVTVTASEVWVPAGCTTSSWSGFNQTSSGITAQFGLIGGAMFTAAGLTQGPSNSCEQKAQNIENLRNEILGRFQDYSDNANPLPLFGRMSRAGHLQQISNKQTALQNALNDYRTSGCGGPGGNAGIPADVNQVAYLPLPALSPSTPSRQDIAVGAAVVVGVAAILIFAPEIVILSPALAF